MIQSRKKRCSGCDQDKVIWKNHQGKKYCLTCWNWLFPPSKLRVTTPTKIRPVSDKRKGALNLYKETREAYFMAHPECEFPGCTSTDITLHHKKGRIGSLLTDSRYFCSLCWTHHQWVEEHPTEAKQLGLSLSRFKHESN